MGFEVGPGLSGTWAAKSKGTGIWIQVVPSCHRVAHIRESQQGICRPGLVVDFKRVITEVGL